MTTQTTDEILTSIRRVVGEGRRSASVADGGRVVVPIVLMDAREEAAPPVDTARDAYLADLHSGAPAPDDDAPPTLDADGPAAARAKMIADMLSADA